MKIVETLPDEVINVWQYRNDIQDGHLYDLDYLREQVGTIICARLVINGVDELGFADNFNLKIGSITELKGLRHAWFGRRRPEIMRILPAEPEQKDASTPSIEPSQYYLSTDGLLLPPSHLKWMGLDSAGYFPTNTDGWDDALSRLTTVPSSSEPLVCA